MLPPIQGLCWHSWGVGLSTLIVVFILFLPFAASIKIWSWLHELMKLIQGGGKFSLLCVSAKSLSAHRCSGWDWKKRISHPICIRISSRQCPVLVPRMAKIKWNSQLRFIKSQREIYRHWMNRCCEPLFLVTRWKWRLLIFGNSFKQDSQNSSHKPPPGQAPADFKNPRTRYQLSKTFQIGTRVTLSAVCVPPSTRSKGRNLIFAPWDYAVDGK